MSTENSPVFPYPRGWFVIGFSDAVGVGHVEPMRYFGRDLVLFRTESGAPRVLDAFCPHLGAHLGHGGVVEGEAIKCPFHAWKFDGTGKCTDVPYASKIPPKAKLGGWTVAEKNGMIYLWNDEEGNGPSWEIPEIDGMEDAAWVPWSHAILEIATQPKEIIENLGDLGHFGPVHGTWIDDFDNEFDGHIASQITKGVAYPLGGGEDHFEGKATYFGPAYMVSYMKGVLESIIINAHTPIDGNKLHLRFAASLRVRPEKAEKMRPFCDTYVDNLREGFLQDVRIWENKEWRERPVLCDGDGPIGKVRRWYKQFYLPAEAG